MLVNAPRGYRESLGTLPTGAKLLKSGAKGADVVQVFVANRSELEAQLTKVKDAVAPGGILWVTYYKGTAKAKTDCSGAWSRRPAGRSWYSLTS